MTSVSQGAILIGKKEVWKTWESYWEPQKTYRKEGSYSNYFFDTHLLLFEKWLNFSNKKVLEVGVGKGKLLLEIAKKGAEVFGVDVSKSAIELAQRRFQLKGHILQGDGLALCFENNSFDFAYSLGLIEHFRNDKNKARIVEELGRVTKQNGLVVISVPKRRSVYTPKKLINKMTGTWKFGYEEEFNTNELLELLDPHFKNIEIKGVDIHPSLFRLVSSVGPLKWIDSRIVIPIIEKIEKNYPKFVLKIAHMLCAKGTPR